MKTLYEVLEVSENASNEIIERAYKVLAKKYHPDLQPPEKKAEAEKKMKEINEAYEILKEETKRQDYDKELAILREEEKRKEEANKNTSYNTYQNQSNLNYNNINHQTNGNYYTNTTHSMAYDKMYDMQRRRQEEDFRKQEAKLRKQMEENLQREYENAYYNYLRRLGYRIKERWTWKKTRDLLITLFVIAFVFTLLWFIPPTHDMLVDFYEDNQIVKIIVDIVVNIVKAIFGAIGSLFTGNK